VKAGIEPGEKPCLGHTQIHIGHPDLGKSERPRPLPKAIQPQRAVDSVTLIHTPIIRTLTWPDEAGCARFAAAMAAALLEIDASLDVCIELQGPLGAGKTAFTRHLLGALGVQGRIKSPTYTLMETYAVGPAQIAHFDFYRFDDPHEWIDAGLRDAFAAPGLKISEWPQKAAGMLPTADLVLGIEPLAADKRHVTITAHTSRGASLLQAAIDPAALEPTI
jgi:tRNA threonylcarbamoyladenosine biosynthesis protein TsaE